MGKVGKTEGKMEEENKITGKDTKYADPYVLRFIFSKHDILTTEGDSQRKVSSGMKFISEWQLWKESFREAFSKEFLWVYSIQLMLGFIIGYFLF